MTPDSAPNRDGSTDNEQLVSENVEIVDSNGSAVEVRLICDGCGEEIDQFEVFEDQVESLPDRPLHDSLSCSKEARS